MRKKMIFFAPTRSVIMVFFEDVFDKNMFFLLKQKRFSKILPKSTKNVEKTWKKPIFLELEIFVGGCFFFSILHLRKCWDVFINQFSKGQITRFCYTQSKVMLLCCFVFIKQYKSDRISFAETYRITDTGSSQNSTGSMANSNNRFHANKWII